MAPSANSEICSTVPSRIPLRIATSPLSGKMLPCKMASSVDFPDPFGPIIPMRSPSETVNEMLRKSGDTPNRFANPRALMIGGKRPHSLLTSLCGSGDLRSRRSTFDPRPPSSAILAPLATPSPPRSLNTFDATMIVMGGIVGSGIFINPYVVALHVHTPFLILGVWVLGGILALLGGFIWAELATRLPQAGGQYLYLREAYHPSVAFLYGWVLLLVTQTGGMAAVAVTFAKYFREISGVSTSDGAIAALVLLGLTAINCLGARAGSNVQSLLMILKSAAIVALVVLGLALGGGHLHHAAAARPACFDVADWRHRRRDDPDCLCLRRLANCHVCRRRDARSSPRTFARPDRRRAWRRRALSLGEFCLFTRPRPRRPRREPHARERGHARCTWRSRRILDRRGNRDLDARLLKPRHPHCARAFITRWPATVSSSKVSAGFRQKRARQSSPSSLQGIAATIIALSGRYEQILNYVVSIDFISFGAYGRFPFRFSPARRNRARSHRFRSNALSRPRPSLHHRAVRSRVRGHRDQHDHHLPHEQRPRLRHSRSGNSRIFILEPEAAHCTDNFAVTKPTTSSTRP